MNIAILGKSRMNHILKQKLKREGFLPLLFEDLNAVASIRGHKGAFVIKSGEDCSEASYILVTEEPISDQKHNAELKAAMTLEDIAAIEAMPYSEGPVVFILDYPEDSPAYMTRTALEQAIWLARRKRKVIYLAKFMRTAGDGLENLYREARNLGVVFFKYSSISVDNGADEGAFRIIAKDMYDTLKICTHMPVFAGRAVYTKGFEKICRLLKIKTEDRFFLFPSLTNRKGIYFINSKNTSGSESEWKLQMEYILSDIKGDLQISLSLPNQNLQQTADDAPYAGIYAMVDAEKCAFCYTCYRTCPHFSMVPDQELGVMKNLPDSCYGCGICASVCPANAITMAGKEDRAKKHPAGSLKIFCCENSGEIALGKLTQYLRDSGVRVEVAALSCGGELSTDVITSALKEFDRVLVAVCMDNACRHFEGSKRARRYVERAKEMLRNSGMDESRIVYMQLSHAMPLVLGEYIKEMV